jgi:hypothetical protein
MTDTTLYIEDRMKEGLERMCASICGSEAT